MGDALRWSAGFVITGVCLVRGSWKSIVCGVVVYVFQEKKGMW